VLTKDGVHTLVDIAIQHEQIYFVNLAQLKDLLPLKQLKAKKGITVTNIPLIISSFQQLMCLVVETNKMMCSYMIMPMPCGTSKGKKALLF